jgi:NDP-sugar pyrophosphorylase family protein
VEVAGHPFLWHQIQLLKRRGIRRVIVSVGYLGEQIADLYGNGAALGVFIEYSFDGPTLLGTAGAIRKALPMLPEQFFVLYGDSYLTCDYHLVEHAFRNSGLPGLITVYRNDGMYGSSNVEYDGTRILRYDKQDRTPNMHHIDYGLSAFRRSVFAALPENDICDLASVFQQLLRKGRLTAFEVHERFYEIGSRDGLRDTETFLKAETPV